MFFIATPYPCIWETRLPKRALIGDAHVCADLKLVNIQSDSVARMLHDAAQHMRDSQLCRETQERLALLYYFSADYEDALAEVDMILAADPDATQELQLFRQKLLLWKALESTLD